MTLDVFLCFCLEQGSYGPLKVLMRPTAYSKFSWFKEVYVNEFREPAKTDFGGKSTN